MELGYSVLPILPAECDDGTTGKWEPSIMAHGMAPGEFTRGQWRLARDWQKYCERAPSEFEVRLWSLNWPAANIGIPVGGKVRCEDGELRKLIAFDIDALDTDLVDEILRVVPWTPNAKRGRKGQTNFYVADLAMGNAIYEIVKGQRVIDLLAYHRQTVAPPSIHPKTLRPYEWLDPQGLTHVSKLPVLDASAIAAVEELLTMRGWGGHRRQREGRVSRETTRAATGEGAYFDEAKGAAMDNFDAWVPHLGLVNLERTREGYEATAHWRPGGTGKPLAERKRNLKIHPGGIRDFGDNRGYSPIDLTMEALGLDEVGATAWLRVRLGIDRPPVTTADLSGQLARQEAAAAALRAPPTPTTVAVVAKPPVAAYRAEAEIPAALLRVPGLLGALTDWIVNTSRRPQAGLSLGAAMTVIGTAAGRRYAGPTKSGTHLYVLGLARTSAGKDHPLRTIPRLLTAGGYPQAIGPSQFMSLSAVINRMTREPNTLAGIDEFGSFLSRINSKRASPHEVAISGMLRTLWGASFGTVTPPEWAAREAVPIHAPSLSMYCVSTPQEFYEALRGADVSNGFLNRFLLLSTRTRPPEQTPKLSNDAVPETIITDLRAIANSGNPLRAASMHVNGVDPPETVVQWRNAEAEEVYVKFGRYIENEREEDINFFARSVEMAVRMATIRAIGIDPTQPRISVSDIEWACELALWSAERMRIEVKDWMAENEFQSEAQRAVRFIREAGRLSHSDLLRRLKHKMKARDVNQMMEGLVDAGEVRIVSEDIPPNGGRPARYYEATEES
jgi:Bifunctional DNA primase/polymerase, N-terminal